MLKMYHYSKCGNTILKDELLGIRKSGQSLMPYAHRAQTEDPNGCKDGSDAQDCNEKFRKIELNDVDCSLPKLGKCDSKKGLLFAVIRHYLLVLKNGYIPPNYLQKEE